MKSLCWNNKNLVQFYHNSNFADKTTRRTNQKRIMKNEKLPQFQPHFLAPKYWGFWLGVAIWRSLLLLPYPILRHIGNGLGWLFSKLKVGKRRATIARRNLELCFPEMPEQEREAILQENLRAVEWQLLKPAWHGFGLMHALKNGQKLKD